MKGRAVMKKRLMAGIVAVLLLPMALVACQKSQSPQGSVPPMDNGTKSVNTEITYDEFLSQSQQTKTVELTYPGSLVVTLGSNPTTGFQWDANPAISDAAVLSQYEHNFVSPTSTAVGAPGKDVWTFKPLKKGTATVSFSYSRPWEGGEKNQWTLNLTVVVK